MAMTLNLSDPLREKKVNSVNLSVDDNVDEMSQLNVGYYADYVRIIKVLAADSTR